MRKRIFIFSLSLIVISSLFFFYFLCSLRTNDPEKEPSFIRALYSYLSHNYNIYRLPDDSDTIILQKDLLTSQKSLDLSYLFNDSIAINGSYPPDEKWSFFKYPDDNKICGIFYGTHYKIIAIMSKKNRTWRVIDLYALKHTP